MTKHLVFVYGTLRRGSRNHGFLAGQRLIGPGRTVDDYSLFVDDIPYVAKTPVSRIVGEVYEVDDACLAALDELEEHPEVYRRERVEIELDSGKVIYAWLYFHPEPGGRLAEEGDFMAI